MTMSLYTLIVSRSAVVHRLCALHILHRYLCRLHIATCRISSGRTDSWRFFQYLDMTALLSVLPHRYMHLLHDTVTLLHSRH